MLRRARLQTWGLPPQVRGALGDEVQQCRLAGLTPAGAGSTAPSGNGRRICSAYPRRCGEHMGGLIACPRSLGLPPQVRGARNGPR